MACGNLIKHEIQNLFGNWLNILSIERQLTVDQMDVCNSVFLIILQEKLKWFLFFIKDLIYFIDMFAYFLVADKGKSFKTKRQLAPPHPIRRSTKPISKIIILGIEMIFSF